MKRILIISLLLLSSITSNYACDCRWAGDFLQLAKKTNTIVKVEIMGHEALEQGIKEVLVCKVQKVYKGQLTSDTIKLRGDDGMICAPYVSYFKLGQQYVLQFDEHENEHIPWLSNCGEYYLELKQGKVYSEKGIRADLAQIGVMNLQRFEELISSAYLDKVTRDVNKEDGLSETGSSASVITMILAVSGIVLLTFIAFKLKRR